MSDPKSPAESSTTDGLTDGLTSEPTGFDVLLEAAMRESYGRSKRPMTPSLIEEPRKHCNHFEGGWEHSRCPCINRFFRPCTSRSFVLQLSFQQFNHFPMVISSLRRGLQPVKTRVRCTVSVFSCATTNTASSSPPTPRKGWPPPPIPRTPQSPPGCI